MKMEIIFCISYFSGKFMVAFSLHCCVISFFSNTLEGLGFDINPYGRFVENKMI